MRMLVVSIVRMAMGMLLRVMVMVMLMPFCDVHPNSEPHERSSGEQRGGKYLTEKG